MKIKLFHLSVLLFAHVTCIAGEVGEVNVPIDKSQTGNLYVNAVINSQVRSQFMVDTGAGMITLNRALFKQISREGSVEKIGKIAARLANGKYQTMALYKVESFSIGENCDLGEMEVAVMNNSGRNILGLSALIKVAPFSIHTNPMELILSGCPASSEALAANQSSDNANSNSDAMGREAIDSHLIDESRHITSTTSPNLF